MVCAIVAISIEHIKKMPFPLTSLSSCPIPSPCHSSKYFEFLHPSIAQLLSCEGSSASSIQLRIAVDPITRTIQWTDSDSMFSSPPNVEDLGPLARACEASLFRKDVVEEDNMMNLSSSQRSLLYLVEDSGDDPSTILFATLIALNQLEASIVRCVLDYNASSGAGAHSNAPPLQILLKKLNGAITGPLPCMLRQLLLPTGLNLRNVLWHGFVGALPTKAWLSLLIVLTVSLVKKCNLESIQWDKEAVNVALSRNSAIVQLRSFPTLEKVIERGENIAETLTTSCIPNTIPFTHMGLWRICNDLLIRRQNPASLCVIMTILLEHTLRLRWCRVNNRPSDRLAQPNTFYVTLDGHGQRHQHDLVLHPYVLCSQSDQKGTALCNGLVDDVGGSLMALLTDVYTSSCGGPKLRAALAHGAWDGFLQNEIRAWKGTSRGDPAGLGEDHPEAATNEALWDIAMVLLAALEELAVPHGKQLLNYTPQFSFTATIVSSLQRAGNLLQDLQHTMQTNTTYLQFFHVSSSPLEFSVMSTSSKEVQQRSNEVLNKLAGNAAMWTVEDVFVEHGWNCRLSSLGATRALLDDIAIAASSFHTVLRDALEELDGDKQHRSRDRRRLLRIVASSEVALTVYRFAIFVALQSLDDALDSKSEDESNVSPSPRTLLKAVERTRMVVSTTKTFLPINTERVYKAIVEYTKGKAVKALLAQKYSPSTKRSAKD
jgi:hypothetical protein